MGEFFGVGNVDRREQLGCGMLPSGPKLYEQVWSIDSPLNVLPALMADPHDDAAWALPDEIAADPDRAAAWQLLRDTVGGRWHGDNIVFAGDDSDHPVTSRGYGLDLSGIVSPALLRAAGTARWFTPWWMRDADSDEDEHRRRAVDGMFAGRFPDRHRLFEIAAELSRPDHAYFLMFDWERFRDAHDEDETAEVAVTHERPDLERCRSPQAPQHPDPAVWVSIDRREYVDIARLGAGTTVWDQLAHRGTSAAGPVLGMLCNVYTNDDLDDDCRTAALTGRWYGSRVASVPRSIAVKLDLRDITPTSAGTVDDPISGEGDLLWHLTVLLLADTHAHLVRGLESAEPNQLLKDALGSVAIADAHRLLTLAMLCRSADEVAAVLSQAATERLVPAPAAAALVDAIARRLLRLEQEQQVVVFTERSSAIAALLGEAVYARGHFAAFVVPETTSRLRDAAADLFACSAPQTKQPTRTVVRQALRVFDPAAPDEVHRTVDGCLKVATALV